MRLLLPAEAVEDGRNHSGLLDHGYAPQAVAALQAGDYIHDKPEAGAKDYPAGIPTQKAFPTSEKRAPPGARFSEACTSPRQYPSPSPAAFTFPRLKRKRKAR